jgi:S-adenosylmethionine hydrolase
VFITFLSDYGLQDDFVGTCHGVMRRIAPEIQIIDITHGIPPQAVMQGALVLRNTLPYMPEAVHLAVVDPGVGGPRRPLVLRDRSGRCYVGPDNGLLLPAAEANGGVAAANELANPTYALEHVSRTFHGRDLFAPAAAHLALGLDASELGPPVDPDALVRLQVPQPELHAGRISAVALYVDRYGNVQLNVTGPQLERAGIGQGTRVELELQGERYYAVAARTYADARPGDIILYEDSYGSVAVAINRGSAAQMFALRPGHRVRIRTASASGYGLPEAASTV